ncbi:phosphoribulokinase/uridine kinase family protein [Histoplasma capsulatum G186AR]|nr:phosphoribulokinase/uridine kinase family protein [Histoplasma capsulatum]QSS69538.1 phosphoribulokinase/uridine kinase family protein [Histoplasma capsulatum G186AR]
MMMKSIFCTLSLAALGMAQSSTTAAPPTTTTTGPVTVFQVIVPAATPVPSEASIIGVRNDAITFGIDVDCLPNFANGRCEPISGFETVTIIQGPKTYSQSVSMSGAFVDAACSLSGTTVADCILKVESGKIKGEISTKLTGSQIATAFATITATAGIEKLANVPPNAAPKATGNVNWAIGGAAAALAMVAAL